MALSDGEKFDDTFAEVQLHIVTRQTDRQTQI